MNDNSPLHTYSIDSPVSRLQLQQTDNDLLIFLSRWDGKFQSIKYDSKYHRFRTLDTLDLSESTSMPALGLAVAKTEAYCACEGENSDFSIYKIDINGSQTSKVGIQSNPISHLICLEQHVLCSFSWDRYCRLWDLRADNQKAMSELKLPSEMVDVKREGEDIVGILGGKSITVMNAKNPTEDPAYLEFMKGQKQVLTSIAVDPFPSEDGALGFCVGTMEGRIISCESDMSEKIVKDKSVWRAHACDTKSGKVVFPVSCLSYHPGNGDIMFSGGRDGKVKFNDVNALRVGKRDICKDTMPVEQLEVSSDGNYLVIAKGYHDYEIGNGNEFLECQKNAQIVVYELVESDFPENDDL